MLRGWGRVACDRQFLRSAGSPRATDVSTQVKAVRSTARTIAASPNAVERSPAQPGEARPKLAAPRTSVAPPRLGGATPRSGSAAVVAAGNAACTVSNSRIAAYKPVKQDELPTDQQVSQQFAERAALLRRLPIVVAGDAELAKQTAAATRQILDRLPVLQQLAVAALRGKRRNDEAVLRSIQNELKPLVAVTGAAGNDLDNLGLTECSHL